VLAALGLLAVEPGLAAADWLITPFAGANFGGNTGDKKFFFADRVGIRGDFRYFRSFKHSEGANGFDIDFSGFNFSRATGGIVFRFP